MSTKKFTFDQDILFFLSKLNEVQPFESQKELAEILEVSPQAITKFKKRGKIPVGLVLRYALKNQQSVDRLLGIGKEKSELTMEEERKAGLVVVHREDYGTPECTLRGKSIPVVYMPYFQRQENKVYEIALIEYDAEWFRRTVEDRKGLVSFIMNADNMVPTINIGDPIIISTVHNKLAGAGIYAFVVDDNLMVRRVAPDLDGGLAVSNDNPKYPSVNLTNFSKRAKILGRVVWKTSRV